MTVHPQTTETKSRFVRKERKVREEKQNIFVSLRYPRVSRTGVLAFDRPDAMNSNNGPQMNANEREYFAFHLRSLRSSRTDTSASVVLSGEVS